VVRLLLGDARLAAVEQVERSLDRVAHRTLGGGADVVARLEGIVDGLGKPGIGHEEPPQLAAVCRGKARASQAATIAYGCGSCVLSPACTEIGLARFRHNRSAEVG